jgi:glyoxylase-like metal-dependent hydrolase (beta-lactamase superfamily II)/type 1 glutamine amidotransferase
MASERLSSLSEVAPGVYFRLGDMGRGQCNGGYIICDDYVVAIEAPNPEASAEMFDEVKKLSDKPVRFLIITHGHWDHDGGIDAFTEKDVTVICNENLRNRYIESNKFGSYIGVADRLILTDNGKSIVFFTTGTVHSNTDVFTLLPGRSVLFTGDSVVNVHRPWLGECDIQNWIDTLKFLDKLEVKTVCVGHGPVAGHEVLGNLANYLTNLRDEVGYQVAQGRTFEMTLQQVKAPARKEWLVDDNAFSDHVKAVYIQLTAELPELKPGLMPHALVLIGDHYHPPAYIPPSLEPVFQKIGMPAQFIYDVTKLNARNLKGIRLLVILRDGMNWPEPGGKNVFWMTEEQEKAIAEFVSNGGGFLSLHNSTALRRLDDKPSLYRDVLGSSYNGHGPGDEKFNVRVVNSDHPITRGVKDYVAVDERHTPIIHADDITLLMEAVSGDKTSVNGYVRTYGKGRVCHLANGHNLEVLTNPEMQKLMANAALWCCGID